MQHSAFSIRVSMTPWRGAFMKKGDSVYSLGAKALRLPHADN